MSSITHPASIHLRCPLFAASPPQRPEHKSSAGFSLLSGLGADVISGNLNLS